MIFDRATAYARAAYGALVRGRKLATGVSADDLSSDACVIVLEGWSHRQSDDVEAFWVDLAEPALDERLPHPRGVAQPQDPTEVIVRDWRSITVHGTVRFADPPLPPRVSLDESFAVAFFSAAGAQVSHVAASSRCGCGPDEHKRVLDAAHTWHVGRLRTKTKLEALERFLKEPGPNVSELVLAGAVGLVDETTDPDDGCMAMWFALARWRQTSRYARESSSLRPSASFDTDRDLSTIRELEQPPTAAPPDRAEMAPIEWIMDVAHRMLSSEPVCIDGSPILTLTDIGVATRVVSPTTPTRVSVPQVLRQVFLTVADGDVHDSLYKLALVAAGRVFRADPVPSDHPDRNKVDKQVTRLAVNAMFVMCQRAAHEPQSIAPSALDAMWRFIEDATNTTRESLLDGMRARFDELAAKKRNPR